MYRKQTQKLQCCTTLAHDRCGATLVPLASLAVQLVCTTTVWLLVCTFTLRGHRVARRTDASLNATGTSIDNTDDTLRTSATGGGTNQKLPSLRVIKGLLALWTSAGIVYLTLTLLFLYFFGADSQRYAVLGKVISSVSLHWLCNAVSLPAKSWTCCPAVHLRGTWICG